MERNFAAVMSELRHARGLRLFFKGKQGVEVRVQKPCQRGEQGCVRQALPGIT